MATPITPVKTYVGVLAVLIVFTVLTVALSFVSLSQDWHVLGGLVIAVIKASLVVMFFMHAVHSPRVTWCVIVVSIVFLVILFALMLADVMTRSLVPFMPGH
jgi:cytochrome c oxidase subunit IV